ncbi:MAG: deoxyribose-phosphate aldolase [Bacteroidales bacterium]
MNEREKLIKCLGLIDLTTLKITDTHSSVKTMVEKINNFKKSFPNYPYPASICIYPNFSKTVKDNLTAKGVHCTVVSGCFPASQSYIKVKTMESLMAVENGADEVDIVLALNKFLDNQKEEAAKEIREQKKVVDPKILKVILETGELKDPKLIKEASTLAMENGADFIKTSTGKVNVNATPQAAEIMCTAIKDYYVKTGLKIGFKAAGGVSTPEEALTYYEIVDRILGEEWLCKELFRFGASRMANNILSKLENKEIKYY